MNIIEKIDHYLKQIEQKIHSNKLNDIVIATPLFHHQLFNKPHQYFSDYLAEIQQNKLKLQFHAEQHNKTQVVYLSELIVSQAAALQREIATYMLRLSTENKHTMNFTHDTPEQKLANYYDYLRRLTNRIRDKKSLLMQANSLAEQKILQQDIASAYDRISRYQQAIKRLEETLLF